MDRDVNPLGLFSERATEERERERKTVGKQLNCQGYNFTNEKSSFDGMDFGIAWPFLLRLLTTYLFSQLVIFHLDLSSTGNLVLFISHINLKPPSIRLA